MTAGEITAISAAIGGTFFSGLAAWIRSQIKLAELIVEVKNLKANHREFDETIKGIYSEIKSINEKLHEKADRQ